MIAANRGTDPLYRPVVTTGLQQLPILQSIGSGDNELHHYREDHIEGTLEMASRSHSRDHTRLTYVVSVSFTLFWGWREVLVDISLIILYRPILRT